MTDQVNTGLRGGQLNEQNKGKIIGRAARKFMGCASRLVDAANARAKYDAGSKGLAKANERWLKADAEYDAAYKNLDEIIDELG